MKKASISESGCLGRFFGAYPPPLTPLGGRAPTRSLHITFSQVWVLPGALGNALPSCAAGLGVQEAPSSVLESWPGGHGLQATVRGTAGPRAQEEGVSLQTDRQALGAAEPRQPRRWCTTRGPTVPTRGLQPGSLGGCTGGSQGLPECVRCVVLIQQACQLPHQTSASAYKQLLLLF